MHLPYALRGVNAQTPFAVVGPLGLEPRTRGLKVRCSKPTELEALAQLFSCSQLSAEQRSDLHQFLWSERDVEHAELHGEASFSITSDDPGDRSTALELQQNLLAAVSFYFIHIHVDPGNFEIPTRRLRAGCSASELRIQSRTVSHRTESTDGCLLLWTKVEVPTARSARLLLAQLAPESQVGEA